MNAVNRPVHKIRYGRITATIWSNPSDNGPLFNVTISRSYQDENKKWHDSQSFSVVDLTVVAKISFDAHTWISAQQPQEDECTDQNNGKASRPPRRRAGAA
jgi:hypothetical protein